MKKRLSRPSGHPAPEHISVEGRRIRLPMIAEEVTSRFLERHPDELDRYEDAQIVRDWCEHDTRHLIAWAAAEVRYGESFRTQLDWLGVVLESRGYPAGRIADTLEIAAAVLREQLGEPAEPVAGVLVSGAEHVRATPSFLDGRQANT